MLGEGRGRKLGSLGEGCCRIGFGLWQKSGWVQGYYTPLRSYIFFFGETTHGYETAVPVWLSLKSVLFAWLRMLLVASGGLFAVVSVGALLSSFQDPAGIRFLYIALPTCIGCVIGMRLTRVLEKASRLR